MKQLQGFLPLTAHNRSTGWTMCFLPRISGVFDTFVIGILRLSVKADLNNKDGSIPFFKSIRYRVRYSLFSSISISVL